MDMEDVNISGNRMDDKRAYSPYYILQLFSKSKLFQNKQLKKQVVTDPFIFAISVS